MDRNEFETTKKLISIEISQLDKLIKDYDIERDILMKGQFKYRIKHILAIAGAALFVLALGGLLIMNSLGIFSIGLFPGIFASLCLVGASLGIGAVGEKIFYNDKNKVLLAQYTSEKEDTELHEKEVRADIEMTKANTRKQALEEILASLELKVKSLELLAPRYDITPKEIAQTKEELQESIDAISTRLENLFDDLDTLSTQGTLDYNFWKLRAGYIKQDKIWVSLIAGMSAAIVSFFAFAPLRGTIDIITAAGAMFVPVTCAFPLVVLRKYRKLAKVFDKLNGELGENAISKKESKSPETKKFNSQIDSIITEIVELENRLQENKNDLEVLTREENATNQQLLAQSLEATQALEATHEEVPVEEAQVVAEEKPYTIQPNKQISQGY